MSQAILVAVIYSQAPRIEVLTALRADADFSEWAKGFWHTIESTLEKDWTSVAFYAVPTPGPPDGYTSDTLREDLTDPLTHHAYALALESGGEPVYQHDRGN